MLRRIKMGLVGFTAAAGMLVGLGAVAPTNAGADPVLVRVCVTLQPRGAALTLNGTVILSNLVPGVPRTCVGI